MKQHTPEEIVTNLREADTSQESVAEPDMLYCVILIGQRVFIASCRGTIA